MIIFICMKLYLVYYLSFYINENFSLFYLNEISGKSSRSVSIKESQGCTECWGGDAEGHCRGYNLPPGILKQMYDFLFK